MYDYVRRQQELQPSLFLSKTFHWMEPAQQQQQPRQPSWTHKYARSARDPLAHSSSSLFAGHTAGASPARTLFAFRSRTRPRQLSDAARRPPSGVSGTFVARRRGFTAPASAQPVIKLAARGAPADEASVTSSADIAAEHARSDSDQPAEIIEKGGRELFSSACQPSGFSSPTSASPQPISSFSSPSLAPQPRTICHRARTLMHRVRLLRPDGPHHARRRQQQKLQQRRRHDDQQHARTPAPFTISSVLCTFDNGTLPRKGAPHPAMSRQPPSGHRPAPSVRPQPTPVLGSPRRLPRSPLANPPTIDSIPSSSSEEDGDDDDQALKCHRCARYRGAEWIVTCSASHPVCFGCVQAYVRTLAHTPGAPVPCGLPGCPEQIVRAQLRRCLPPQRMRQLDGARPPTRYPQGSPDTVGSEEEGFDMPLAPEEPDGDAVWRSMATLAIAAEGDVAERAAMSMPALGGRASAGSSSGPMLSERTCVGRASIGSVVAVAAAAADSCESLSPQSVGSRLRRVPKAHEPLAQQQQQQLEQQPQQTDYLPESLAHLARLRAADSADMPDAFGGPALYDYAGDPHMLRTPVQVRHDARSFASTGSPVSWQQPQQLMQQQQPPPPPFLPPPLPAEFRASSTWITPAQRHSGYAENMLLSATLFETIRRKPSAEASEEDEDDNDLYSIFDLDDCSLVAGESSSLAQQPTFDDFALSVVAAGDPRATPGVASTLAPTPVVVQKNDEDRGVYIPTWRRAEAEGRKMPLWAADEFGAQSGVLCEAAELNFDLYETLHRRR